MIIFLSFLLFCLLIFTFNKFGKNFNFIDVPNERSSHEIVTIRGAGFVFSLGFLFAYFFSETKFSYALVSLVLLTIVSILDDKYSLSNKLRFVIQVLAGFLLIIQLNIDFSWWFFPFLVFITVGGINAFNFMDGINGMTALYAVLALITLFIINIDIHFIDYQYIIFPLSSVVAFSFFNVRNRALCFAGDVGSISIAFILLFLLFKLIIHTQNYYYVLILFVYAFESGATIIKRTLKGENIFKPHRKHLYQLLVHVKGWYHLQVSFLYVAVQLLINFCLLYTVRPNCMIFILLIIMISYIFALNYFNKSEK